MTTFAVVISLVLPTIVAAICIKAAFVCSNFSTLLERIAAAAGLAVGVTSALFFLWRLGGGATSFIAPLEITVAALAIAGTLLASRKAPRDVVAFVTTTRVSRSSLFWMAAPLAATLLAAAIAILLLRVEELPHGEWDAWAIWNLRAAFLAAPQNWTDGFTMDIGWSHPDYPLLVAASVARLWTVAGSHLPTAPWMLASFLFAATIACLSGSLLRISGYASAAVGLALLLVPDYLMWVTSQCADAPLGFYVLLAVCLLSGPANFARVALAGAAATFAAWTKNEGIVPAIAIPAGYVALVWMRHSAGAGRTAAWQLLTGIGPVLATIVTFRVSVAPASDLLTGIATTGPWEKFTDASRHQQVLTYMTEELFWWGGWGIVSPFLLAAVWLAIGVLVRRHLSAAQWLALATVLALTVANYVVYVLSPYDLDWHMRFSWPRLISQIWPTFIWAAAIGITDVTKYARTSPR